MSHWSLGCQPHPRLTCLCLKSASSSVLSPPSNSLMFPWSALLSQIFKPFPVVFLSLYAFPYPCSWSLPFFVRPVSEGCLSSLWGSQALWKDSWLPLQFSPLDLPGIVNLTKKKKVIKAWIHFQTDVCGHPITVCHNSGFHWRMPCTHAQMFSVILL